MGKKIGSPKTGGRKKGTPNKNTLSLISALDSNGLDVIGELVNLLPTLSNEKRVDVLLNLCNYIYPKRRAMEIRPEPDNNQVQVVLTLPDNGRSAPT